MRTRRAVAPSRAPATETAQDCSTATFRARSPLDDPGWRPCPVPGSLGVSIGVPAIREPILEPGRHPGVPAGLPLTPYAMTRDQFRRQGRRPPGAAGTTDGDASITANPEDPVGGRSGYRPLPFDRADGMSMALF